MDNGLYLTSLKIIERMTETKFTGYVKIVIESRKFKQIQIESNIRKNDYVKKELQWKKCLADFCDLVIYGTIDIEFENGEQIGMMTRYIYQGDEICNWLESSSPRHKVVVAKVRP